MTPPEKKPAPPPPDPNTVDADPAAPDTDNGDPTLLHAVGDNPLFRPTTDADL